MRNNFGEGVWTPWTTPPLHWIRVCYPPLILFYRERVADKLRRRSHYERPFYFTRVFPALCIVLYCMHIICLVVPWELKKQPKPKRGTAPLLQQDALSFDWIMTRRAFTSSFSIQIIIIRFAKSFCRPVRSWEYSFSAVREPPWRTYSSYCIKEHFFLPNDIKLI